MRDEKRGERMEEGEGERERGQSPLLPRVVNSERRRYLDQSNHAAGSAFYHYFTCFPFTSPSLDDIPRAISWDKKKRYALPEEDSMLPPSIWCPPVPSWYLYLGPATASKRNSSPVALAGDSLAVCPLHEQSLTVRLVRDTMKL